VYATDSECSYFQYNREEVLDTFQGANTDILVVGDSFVRQLFVRLMHLMRGQVRLTLRSVHPVFILPPDASALQGNPAFMVLFEASGVSDLRPEKHCRRRMQILTLSGAARAVGGGPITSTHVHTYAILIVRYSVNVYM